MKVIGTRHGEKLYETLATREELTRAEDQGDYFRVSVDARDLNYGEYFDEGDRVTADEDYHSHNTERLDVDGVVGPAPGPARLREAGRGHEVSGHPHRWRPQRRARVLLVHRYFWPDTPPYAAMLREIGRALVDAGHSVTRPDLPALLPTGRRRGAAPARAAGRHGRHPVACHRGPPVAGAQGRSTWALRLAFVRARGSSPRPTSWWRPRLPRS